MAVSMMMAMVIMIATVVMIVGMTVPVVLCGHVRSGAPA
jgi:hypothetical protein